MKAIVIAIGLLFVGNAYAADQLEITEVSGLSVPGTPAIAKKLKFTDCTAGYNKFECRRIAPTLFYGAKADRAALSIDGKDNFSFSGGSSIAPKVSDVPQDKLTYRSIRMDFHLTERQKLEAALLADGWRKTGSMNNYEYSKEGVGAIVKMQRSLTTLEPKNASEVNKQLSSSENDSDEADKSKTNSDSFLDSMKN